MTPYYRITPSTMTIIVTNYNTGEGIRTDEYSGIAAYNYHESSNMWIFIAEDRKYYLNNEQILEMEIIYK